jgi:hypothetical protein
MQRCIVFCLPPPLHPSPPPTRIRTRLAPPDCRRRLAAWVIAHGGRVHPSGRLWWGGVKEFADGSLGSRTALMWGPYADVGPEHERPTGQRMIDPQRLTQLVQDALAAELQVCAPPCHAVPCHAPGRLHGNDREGGCVLCGCLRAGLPGWAGPTCHSGVRGSHPLAHCRKEAARLLVCARLDWMGAHQGAPPRPAC